MIGTNIAHLPESRTRSHFCAAKTCGLLGPVRSVCLQQSTLAGRTAMPQTCVVGREGGATRIVNIARPHAVVTLPVCVATRTSGGLAHFVVCRRKRV